MPERPTLNTARLVLRPFATEDGPDVQRLAGAEEIASVTLHIPHPYEDGLAEAWIATHQQQFDLGATVTCAVTLRDNGELIGAVGLEVNKPHLYGELGYWIGVPYWRRGYCTEAARAIVGYGFDVLNLHRIYACHLARNPASGRVMRKLGMKQEGYLRHHVRKWGVFEDLVEYGLLRDEWALAGRPLLAAATANAAVI